MNAWGTAFRTRLHKASCCGSCRTGTPIVPPTPNRDPGENAAQRRVAGHLETEIAYFLQRNELLTSHFERGAPSSPFTAARRPRRRAAASGATAASDTVRT